MFTVEKYQGDRKDTYQLLGQSIGVLDIDSPRKSRFDEVDQVYLEQFVQALLPFL